MSLRGWKHLDSDTQEFTMDSAELKRRWHEVELAAPKRAIVMGAFAGILLLFAVVGYFGVAKVTLAAQAGSPPTGVWPLFWHFMGLPLMIGGVAGAIYMAWFIGHHERSVRSWGTALPEQGIPGRLTWRALRFSDRIYLIAYVAIAALGAVARFA